MKPSALTSIGAVLAVFLSSSALAQSTGSTGHDSVQVNGITMSYRLLGQGEPLVLLHGYMGTGADWDPLIDELSAHYRLILPDLRGHGHSTGGSEPLSSLQYALDVEGLLDHLGYRRVRGIGFSIGAVCLLHLATRHPERVEAMVLVSGSSYVPQQARNTLTSDTFEVSPEAMEAMGQTHRGGLDQVQRMVDAIREYYASEYQDLNFTPPLLSTITARTLIIHGDRDWAFPVSIPVGLYEAIPSSYLWIVPNGQHEAFPQSEPGLSHFKATLLGFLSGEWD